MKATRRNDMITLLLTALVPVIWGSTYIVTTEWLPLNRPFTAAAIRSLPAGIILILLGREWINWSQFRSLLLLATLNIALFQGLLFTSAYLLPGGVAAIVGSLQPLIVMVLLWIFDRTIPSRIKSLAGIGAVFGMGLLFIGPENQWNLKGIVAAILGTLSMSVGIYLSSKWQRNISNLSFAGWQLALGGMLLLPVALLFEEQLPPLTILNSIGYIYLSLFGALIGYWLWFRGLQLLPPSNVASLGLLSPITATLLGWFFLGEELGGQGAIGVGIVMVSIFFLQYPAAKRKNTSTHCRPSSLVKVSQR